VNGHPGWCDLTRCTVNGGSGLHQSATIVVTPGRKRTPRIILLLVAPPNGQPVQLRLVVESDVIVNAVEVDIDTGQLIAAHIQHLVASTRPPE
jgi:hypothetical protein